jgi:hypothetical protein
VELSTVWVSMARRVSSMGWPSAASSSFVARGVLLLLRLVRELDALPAVSAVRGLGLLLVAAGGQSKAQSQGEQSLVDRHLNLPRQ